MIENPQQLMLIFKIRLIVNKAHGILEDKEYDVKYSFNCPICGGIAKAKKGSKDAHFSCYCPKCKVKYVQ